MFALTCVVSLAISCWISSTVRVELMAASSEVQQEGSPVIVTSPTNYLNTLSCLVGKAKSACEMPQYVELWPSFVTERHTQHSLFSSCAAAHSGFANLPHRFFIRWRVSRGQKCTSKVHTTQTYLSSDCSQTLPPACSELSVLQFVAIC